MPCLQRPLHSQDPLGARGLGVALVASHNQRHAKGKEPVGCPIQGPAWGWGLKDDSPGSAGTLLHGQYRDPCASRGRCSPSLRPGVPGGLSAQRQVWFSGSSHPCHLSPVESASVPRPGTSGQDAWYFGAGKGAGNLEVLALRAAAATSTADWGLLHSE